MPIHNRLQELWVDAEQSVDIDALTTSLKQIYAYFGQQSRPQHGMPGAGTILKARYENVPAIWDLPRRRFLRPRDCFGERVLFFEPHKVFVTGDSQVQAGLDALGRRQSPEIDDYVDFLQILSAHKFTLQTLGDSGECDTRECQQILNALNFISSRFDQVAQDELPVLTTAHQLLPISEVFEDDAPHLTHRIQVTDINLIDPQVPHRIRSAAPRLTHAIAEILDELPQRSADKQIENVCHRFAAILRSSEFAHGLRRIVAQRHLWQVNEFVPDFDRFDVCPATSINTSLYLETADGGSSRIGGGAVPFFVDADDSVIWIATASPGRVMIYLARAIDALLGDFQGIDIAALEGMLRVSRLEEIQEALDDRRVPRLTEAGQPQFDWDDASQEAANEEGADEFSSDAADGAGTTGADGDLSNLVVPSAVTSMAFRCRRTVEIGCPASTRMRGRRVLDRPRPSEDAPRVRLELAMPVMTHHRLHLVMGTPERREPTPGVALVPTRATGRHPRQRAGP